MTSSLHAVRGELLHFTADPEDAGAAAFVHHHDGLLVIEDGHVRESGPATALLPKLPADARITDYRGKLILPGFVDTHVHYAQTDIIASYGEQLLAWLEKYTFPTEARFADPSHAGEVADFFCDELLRNGTTTALAFATVHPASVDALFDAASRRRMRMIAGKVLMDRNCPDYLSDTADSGYVESKALIDRWHGRERLLYAVTPRFAPTSTREQMTLAGRLFAEHPGLYLQSHVAENRGEVAWVAELYPEARSYLDVYERYGQLGARSVYAHCIWLDDADRQRMAATGSAMSFCPTSNLFLGSGLFDLDRAHALGVRVGIGTDVGGGTSFSMLQTLNEAYKVLQLNGQRLSAERAFYLATLGGARSLYLDGHIGNFATGKEADFVVIDPQATPLMARRMHNATTLSERLFVLMMLGDDRCVAATHVLGEIRTIP
ncbi:guanine deaminase [Azoarcus sp. L1K30]|uniref:guanine deaminase n=1 Tax=Azoarcus sp. L1K30 TaxID=2820277 RepID=UPI001B831507|nr:guanine deaminase [Azoarcus sp. L1K30]MBR0564527.1 guanine deaminase [Azoarcus sp. L1K30]